MSKRPWVIFGGITLLLLVVAHDRAIVIFWALFAALWMAILRKTKRDTGSWFGSGAGHNTSDNPVTNIDGTPMMGSVDINGNPYGVTQHHHQTNHWDR
jgi:predicted permease